MLFAAILSKVLAYSIKPRLLEARNLYGGEFIISLDQVDEKCLDVRSLIIIFLTGITQREENFRIPYR